MDAFNSLVGRLLVAMPGIGDPRFEQAVILVCAHGPDHAMGLRVDRAVPGVDLATVLTKLETPFPENTGHQPVMIGGPVERERGFVLHTDDWVAPDASITFDPGLAMTDPLDGPRRSVLMLGYAGWGEGQLEEELAENVWLIADIDLDVVFDTDHETKWARALRGIGVNAAQLSAQSGRA